MSTPVIPEKIAPESSQPLLADLKVTRSVETKTPFVGSENKNWERKDFLKKLPGTEISIQDTIRDNKKILPSDFSSVEEIRELYKKEIHIKASKEITHYYENSNLAIEDFEPFNKSLFFLGISNNCIRLFNFVGSSRLLYKNDKGEDLSDLIISNNDKYAAFLCNKQIIMRVNIETYKIDYWYTLADFKNLTLLSFTSDEKNIIATNMNDLVIVFDFQTGQKVLDFKIPNKGKMHQMIVSNNQKIVFSFDFGYIKILDLQSQKEEAYLEGVHNCNLHFYITKAIRVTPDNKYLITASWASINVFCFDTYKKVHEFQFSSDESWNSTLTVSKDSKLLISTFQNGSMHIFDLETLRELHVLENSHSGKTKRNYHLYVSDSHITNVAFSFDNKFIMSHSKKFPLRLFQILEFNEPKSLNTVEDENGCMRGLLSRDDKYLIIASRRDKIYIYNLEEDKIEHEIENNNDLLLYAIDLLFDNKYLAYASNNNSINIFDLQVKQKSLTFENAHTSDIYTIKITKDNNFFFSASQDKSIKKFDLIKKTEVICVKDIHNGSIMCLNLSAKDDCLISASADKTVKVLDPNTMEVIYDFKTVHNGSIVHLELSHDDKMMLTSSVDRTVKLFDFETKQEIYQFKDDRIDIQFIPEKTLKFKQQFGRQLSQKIINIFYVPLQKGKLYYLIFKQRRKFIVIEMTISVIFCIQPV